MTFKKTREFSPDDSALIAKIEAKREYDRQRTAIALSDDAYEFFNIGNWAQQRYQRFFVPADFYIDHRPPEIKAMCRMFEVEFAEENPRRHKTMVMLNDVHKYHLGELFLLLDLHNEPNIIRNGNFAWSHAASILLEAIAAGYIEIKGVKNDDV